MRNHMMYHEKQAGDPTLEEVLACPAPRCDSAGVSLSVGQPRWGCDFVRVSITIDGKTIAELEQRAAEDAAAFQAAKRARDLEGRRRAEQRHRERESADAAMAPQQRRGSDRRRSYSAKEKLCILDFYEKVRGDGSITRKVEYFGNDQRSRGATFGLVSKWNRRDVERGAAQEHAGTLLRIDKTSRRMGKYAAMEKRLYALFKERRARARKVSAKWFVHTARHIMRSEFSEHATAFRGSRGWMRRFLKRFSLVPRRKTNCKNTTWEQTKPVLQRYFRSTRRRLRDEAWHAARAAAVAAARARPAVAAAPAASPPSQRTRAQDADEDEGEAGRQCARRAWDSAAAAPAEPLPDGNAAAAAVAPTEPLPDGIEAAQPSPHRSPRKRARDDEAAAAAVEPDVPWHERKRAKWGKYLPHQRFNVDQVPMPFIFDMGTTYEEKGAKRVAINQLGPSLSKRQMTAQVCFRPEPPPPPPESASDEVKSRFKKHLMEQPPPCLIFRGTGQMISQREKDAYPPELVVLWQPKAWVDRPTAVGWAKQCYKKVIDADRAAGVADESSRYLLFEDNLDSQGQPAYLETLSAECQTDDHKVPPNKTDQVQPVDRGLGRQLQIYMGQEEDEWLEDDENLQRYENNELTTSDRRILLAQWYCKAYQKAMESRATRKYFEHAGALLTADGSDDDLIKLEGVPRGEKFTWEDDVLDEPMETADLEPEPEDVCPERPDPRARLALEGDEVDETILDDEDDPDDDDAPPAPKVAPPGFRIRAEPPPEEHLAFSKEEAAPGDDLVESSILYRWPSVGWCVGKIVERNANYRFTKKIDNKMEKVNFLIFYEIDGDTVKTVLRSEDYGGEEDGSWVLLEPEGSDAEAEAAGL